MGRTLISAPTTGGLPACLKSAWFGHDNRRIHIAQTIRRDAASECPPESDTWTDDHGAGLRLNVEDRRGDRRHEIEMAGDRNPGIRLDDGRGSVPQCRVRLRDDRCRRGGWR